MGCCRAIILMISFLLNSASFAGDESCSFNIHKNSDLESVLNALKTVPSTSKIKVTGSALVKENSNHGICGHWGDISVHVSFQLPKETSFKRAIESFSSAEIYNGLQAEFEKDRNPNAKNMKISKSADPVDANWYYLVGESNIVVGSTNLGKKKLRNRCKEFTVGKVWKRLCTLDTGFLDGGASLEKNIFISTCEEKATGVICSYDQTSTVKNQCQVFKSGMDIGTIIIDRAISIQTAVAEVAAQSDDSVSTAYQAFKSGSSNETLKGLKKNLPIEFK